jgi:phage shock protein C
MTRKLYRSRNGMIFGVCRGIADTFDLSLFWVRLGFIIAFAITLFFPTGLIYLILALVLKREPDELLGSRSRDVIFDGPNDSSRKVGLRQFKAKFDSLENRIRRMESHVTDRAYDWDKRLNTD